MQYITTGNRIAVENFVLGDLYTITFTSGTYINSACIGIGENFVSFQRNEPELLFTLNMETAELVSSIDLYAGGTGTNNYNELSNKPQIGGVELVGNKSLSDLGIQAEITEESPLSSSLVSGLGSAAAAESSDFATAAQGALAASAIQSAGSGLSKDGTTLNHSNSVTAKTTEGFAAITYDAQGHITGSTAATTAQLAAINSGITSTDVAQIETNKTNILSLIENGGGKNLLPLSVTTAQTVNGVIFTPQNDGTIKVTGSLNAANAPLVIGTVELPAGTYTLSGSPLGGGESTWQLDTTTPSYYQDIGSGVSITLAQTTTVTVRIRIAASGTLNLLFKPMLSTSTDMTFQPYALSNVDLTTATKQNQTNISSLTPTKIPATTPLTDSNIEDNATGTVLGNAQTINGKAGWCAVHTYILNDNGSRRMQIVEFSDGVRYTRYYDGTWQAWV